jgi:uncharacterized OB-fold protein
MGDSRDDDADAVGLAPTVAAPPAHAGTKPSLLAMTKCPKCQVVTPVARFCTACGVALAARRFCSECGERLKPGAPFCDACGAEVA